MIIAAAAGYVIAVAVFYPEAALRDKF